MSDLIKTEARAAVEEHGERAVRVVADRKAHARTDETRQHWARVEAEIRAMRDRGEAPRPHWGRAPKHPNGSKRVHVLLPTDLVERIDAQGQDRSTFVVEAAELLLRKRQRSR